MLRPTCVSCPIHSGSIPFYRIQIVSDGKKRKLVINGCKLEDAGNITCKTNADESSANLGVQCKDRLNMRCSDMCYSSLGDFHGICPEKWTETRSKLTLP